MHVRAAYDTLAMKAADPKPQSTRFKPQRLSRLATHYDAAGIALRAAIGLDQVAEALEAIQQGRDPSEHIELIRKMASEIDKLFDDLTGYTPNER